MRHIHDDCYCSYSSHHRYILVQQLGWQGYAASIVNVLAASFSIASGIGLLHSLHELTVVLYPAIFAATVFAVWHACAYAVARPMWRMQRAIHIKNKQQARRCINALADSRSLNTHEEMQLANAFVIRSMRTGRSHAPLFPCESTSQEWTPCLRAEAWFALLRFSVTSALFSAIHRRQISTKPNQSGCLQEDR